MLSSRYGKFANPSRKRTRAGVGSKATLWAAPNVGTEPARSRPDLVAIRNQEARKGE